MTERGANQCYLAVTGTITHVKISAISPIGASKLSNDVVKTDADAGGDLDGTFGSLTVIGIRDGSVPTPVAGDHGKRLGWTTNGNQWVLLEEGYTDTNSPASTYLRLDGASVMTAPINAGGYALTNIGGAGGSVTGTPLYAYTEADPAWTAASNAVAYTDRANSFDATQHFEFAVVSNLQLGTDAASTGLPGMIRFNASTNRFEGWIINAWEPLGSGIASSGRANYCAPEEFAYGSGNTIMISRASANWYQLNATGNLTLTFADDWPTNAGGTVRIDIRPWSYSVSFPTNSIRAGGSYGATNLLGSWTTSGVNSVLFDKAYFDGLWTAHLMGCQE